MEFSKINIQDLQLDHSIEINPSSGSATCMIALPLPEGRNGFNPSLSLVYSSSSRNSTFGAGWSLSGLPFIAIDTKKGLPKYNGTDKYAFNGSSTIEPQLVKTGTTWKPRVEETPEYFIYYYRSRLENNFTRFEKWVKKTGGEIHWRTRSTNNILSVYGLDTTGITKINDPENKNNVFVWLLESQYDLLGNAVQFRYKKEDREGVDATLPYEKNRVKYFAANGFTQKYPDKIVYGNTHPVLPDTAIDANNKWLFEVVFDYGQYTTRPYTNADPPAGATWKIRKDPFSVYTPGFEIRTYRLCRRILLYHHFDELSTPTSLTGIITCNYQEADAGTTLTSLAYTGVRRDLFTGVYSEKSLPALSFKYTRPQTGRSFTSVTPKSTENLPQGFNHRQTRWVDLFGEGIPGILTESANAWYYKQNLGNGEFGGQSVVIQKPSQDLGVYALGDFDNDGNLNLFTLQGRMAGYYEYNRDEEAWSGFRPFEQIPQVGATGFIDVNADGFADIVVEYDDRIYCYPFKGREGFDKPYGFAKPQSNGADYAPLLGNNLQLDFFMADMTGDGLPDQVRITNGRVIYYPNSGNGKFGEGVLMENAPVFDFDNTFDAGRIRLYDLDGSGTTDIVYIGNGELKCWINASGNKFVEGITIKGLPYIDNISSVLVLDLLGKGTPCLVWSSSLSCFEQSPVQYLELTNGTRPRLLISMENGMGKEEQIAYGFSGTHYLQAKASGNPWISKIPSHFPVAEKHTIIDHITNTRFVTEYRYRDGHYDGNEHSFVTFGQVEQYDTSVFEMAAITHDNDYTRARCTKTWLHSGLYGWEVKRARQYYKGDPLQPALPVPFFEQPDALESEDFIRGYQSLAGSIIRQEVYGTNENGIPEDHPYLVNQTAFCIRQLQPKQNTADSCYYSYETESLAINYEKNAADPKITHNLTVQVDNTGQVEKELTIAYARRNTIAGRLPAQSRDIITAGKHQYIFKDELTHYQAGILTESQNFEINHLNHNLHEPVNYILVKNNFDGLVNNAIPFDQQLSTGGVSKARLVLWHRTYYWNNARDNVLPPGQAGNPVLAHHEESACFNDNLVTAVYAGKVTSAMLSDSGEGNYLQKDGYWWQHSAVTRFNSLQGFFTPDTITGTTGNVTAYKYDPYFLHITEITDPTGNKSIGEIDYNIIEHYRITDQNDNVSEVLYDALGVDIARTFHGTVLDDGGTLQQYGNGLIENYTRRNDETFENVLANPAQYLQQAAIYQYYDLDAWQRDSKPLRSIQLHRETLVHDGKGSIQNSTRVQLELDYQDGFGRIIQVKRKVEDGPAIQRQADGSIITDTTGIPVLTHTTNRWLVSGHIVYNNKIQPVRQFEPFFSGEPAFENDAALESYGASTHNYYDTLDRLYRTDFPNNTFTEIQFTAWEIQSFDQNDNVDRSLYKTFREIQPAGSPERMALDKSLAHKDTPTIVQLDPLDREIVITETNNNGTVRRAENTYDIHGNLEMVTDARSLKAFEYKRDMQGRLLYEKSMDAGENTGFHDNNNLVIHRWDSRQVHQRMLYDKMERIVSVHVDGALGLNHLTERFVYGDDVSVTNAKQKNLVGSLVKHFDQAGTRELLRAWPGGMAAKTARKLLTRFDAEPDWNNPAAVALATDTYTSDYTYDSLGRPVEQKLPDGTTRKYLFNQGGALQQLLLSTADGAMNDVPVLKNTSHDAKGFRQTALLGNDVEIASTYDAETNRMRRLRTIKTTGTPRVYQDIQYTYDPVGNLIYAVDEAQQPASADPKVLEGLTASAHMEFKYDALYQLTEAKGRVHQALLQHDYSDRSRENAVPANWTKGTRHISLNNAASIERYTRTYVYDEAGNLQNIQHSGTTQNFNTQIWTSATSNRSLPLLDLNGIAVTNPESRYDANGNCIYLPHLRSLEWNYRNNISKAIVIDRSAQGKPNDEEYYVYGGDGLRVRKVTQRVIDVANNATEQTETIYLDDCEIKRITRGNTEILKRYTSPLSDGTNKIALVHSWATDIQARETDDITQKKIHYQLGNHLGSASLELDENGEVITYEEYFPYGGTSFIAGRNKRDIDLKYYRYCAKERDDFTGLYYFGYRYYAHWIGGWMSPDPLGPEDADNLYLYVQNNPVNLVDPNGLQSKKTTREEFGGPDLPTKKDALEYWEGRIITMNGQRIKVHVKNIEPGTAETKTQWELTIEGIPVDEKGNPLPQPATPDDKGSVKGQQNQPPDDKTPKQKEPGSSGDGKDKDPGTKDQEPGSSKDKKGDDDKPGPGVKNGDGKKGTQEHTHGKPNPGDGGTGQKKSKGKDGDGTGDKKQAGSRENGTGDNTSGQPGGSETGNVNAPENNTPPVKGNTNVPGGKPPVPGQIPGTPGDGKGGGTKNTGGNNAGSPSGKGSSGGADPNKPYEEPAWWERALLAMAGAIYAIANIFIETGKMIYDMVGLAVSCFGIATGWYNYEHQVASGIGHAAEQGKGTLDIFKDMGRGIIETPARAWQAAERGDWFAFGSESMNLYMLGRSAYGAGRSLPSLARGAGSLGRSGVSRISNFFRGGRNPSFTGQQAFPNFMRAHGGMGASSRRGIFSFSKGYSVRSSPLKYGLWRAGIAGRNLAQRASQLARKMNPMRLMSSYGKGLLGREMARVKSFFRRETLLGRELNATVDGIRIVADLAVMDKHGFIKIIEAKLGPHSHMTTNQLAAWKGGSIVLRIETFFGSKVKVPK